MHRLARKRLWLLALFILPQGLYMGLISLVLPWLLTNAHVPVDEIAHLTSILTLPWICYFIWSPLADTTLTLRRWLLLGALLSSVCIPVTLNLAEKAGLAKLTAAGLAGSIGATIVMAACGGLILSNVQAADRGHAAAWYETGKLAGRAFGAAFLFAAISCVGSTMAGAALGVLALAAVLPAFSLSGAVKEETLRQRLRDLRSEAAALAAAPERRSTLIVLASPLGASAALDTLPGIAKFYHVGSSGAVWMNGWVGGITVAAGALSSAFFPESWSKRKTYAAAGLSNALAVLILLSGQHPGAYYCGAVCYFLTAGLCWARYAALAAEAADTGGNLVSTRYSLVASAGNLPLAYMLWLEGIGFRQFGLDGLLWTDIGGSLIGLMIAFAL